MPASTDLREGLAEAFDTLASEFQEGAVVKLLKPSTTANEFAEIRTVEDKRFFEYSNFRKNSLLEIADTSEQLTDDIQNATHVSIDDVVYVIRTGDTLEPAGTNPVWQLYLDIFERHDHYVSQV